MLIFLRIFGWYVGVGLVLSILLQCMCWVFLRVADSVVMRNSRLMCDPDDIAYEYAKYRICNGPNLIDILKDIFTWPKWFLRGTIVAVLECLKSS